MRQNSCMVMALLTALAVTCGASTRSPAAEYGPWGFDLSGMDLKAKPGDSFFDYANGAWVARTEIPADKASFGAFDVLYDKSQEQLRAIIEDAAKSGAAADTDLGRISALYRAMMDEARIEQLDASPIAADLTRIRAARTRPELAALMGRTRSDFGKSLFSISVSEDNKEPDRNAAHLSQADLGLPDRDYYLQAAFGLKKAKYRDYVAQVLGMIGWPDATANAGAIVDFETRVAEASWSRAESRDPDKTYNPMTVAELVAYAPGFPWQAWLQGAQLGDVSRFVVLQKSAFPKIAQVFAETPVETLQAWAAFSAADEAASYLSARFVTAKFEFRGKELSGQLEDLPRWKRGVQLVDGALGEALGREYVARHFPADSKAKMEMLVAQLRVALQHRIENLQWMTPATKAKALEKLSKFQVKIGHPPKWRDYSALEIDATDLVGNVRRMGEFQWAYERGKVGKPIDPDEWEMTPQTVNAYFSWNRNELVFPAAILQPPFFDPNADMAINYGGIGGVIGHEMTHGFDDQGRKFDANGKLTDWWQPEDAAKFNAEAARYGAQFDKYSVAPGVFVQGDLTMGENIADLGGILLAVDAYRLSLAGRPSLVLDGFTGDQRVFLGWAQVWRSKSRPDDLILQVTTDPHAPARFRVDGPTRNVDAWYDAWGVKPGDHFYLKPEERVRIW